jgi:hypothetical protein
MRDVGIRLFDLVAPRVQPIRQIKRAVERDHSINQSLGHLQHVDFAFGRDFLTERHHRRDARGSRISHHGGRVGGDVPERDVQEFRLGRRYDLATRRQKLLEPRRRDEIFVQYVGARTKRIGEIGDRLVHQGVSCRQPRTHLGVDRSFGVPPQPLGRLAADLLAVEIAGNPVHRPDARGRRQRRGLRRSCAIGRQQRFMKESGARHRKPPVGHQRMRVVLDRRHERLGECVAGHQRDRPLEHDIRGHLDIEVDDHAKQAVAAHREREQFGIFVARAFEQRPVREQQTQRPHRRAERAIGHGPAVGVDAERAGDAEIGVGLHHFGRKAERVELGDDVPPPRARRNAIELVGGIDLEPGIIESDGDAVARQALSAHRVARRAHGDPPARSLRRFQLATQILEQRVARGAAGPHMLGDRRRVEPAGVVHDDTLFGVRNTGKLGRGAGRERGGQKRAPVGCGNGHPRFSLARDANLGVCSH